MLFCAAAPESLPVVSADHARGRGANQMAIAPNKKAKATIAMIAFVAIIKL